jgi:PIN domain nuclease of toxin-antitoxin system
MNLLLDTHSCFGLSAQSYRLSAKARTLLGDPANQLIFSAASLWEVSIKHGLRRPDFQYDARLLRRGLLDSGSRELPVTSQHALALASLPQLHRDPFDRRLLAQSIAEGITLVTADPLVARYPAPIERV